MSIPSNLSPEVKHSAALIPLKQEQTYFNQASEWLGRSFSRIKNFSLALLGLSEKVSQSKQSIDQHLQEFNKKIESLTSRDLLLKQEKEIDTFIEAYRLLVKDIDTNNEHYQSVLLGTDQEKQPVDPLVMMKHYIRTYDFLKEALKEKNEIDLKDNVDSEDEVIDFIIDTETDTSEYETADSDLSSRSTEPQENALNQKIELNSVTDLDLDVLGSLIPPSSLNMMHLEEYENVPNAAGGDCLFYSMEQGLNFLGKLNTAPSLGIYKQLRSEACKYIEDYYNDDPALQVFIRKGIEAQNNKINQNIKELEQTYTIEGLSFEDKKSILQLIEQEKANLVTTPQEFLDQSKDDGFFVGEAHIYALSQLYNVPILVTRQDAEEKYYFAAPSGNDPIILDLSGGNHYELKVAN